MLKDNCRTDHSVNSRTICTTSRRAAWHRFFSPEHLAFAVVAAATAVVLYFSFFGASKAPPTKEESRGEIVDRILIGTGADRAADSKVDELLFVKDLSAEALFEQTSPAVVRIDVRDRNLKLIGQGSGFLVADDGLVATNYHVIAKAYSAHVTFPDGSRYPVEGLAASERSSDLALLKISGRKFPALSLANDELPVVGAKVYAIGNPQGLTNSLSDGLVSGHRKLDGDVRLIQTTAAISAGSSGGPLLSNEGLVVGVTTSSIAGGQNLNIAVPVGTLKAVIKGKGRIQTLASAGGEPLKPNDAEKLDQIWIAIDKEDFSKALKLLAQLRGSQKGSAAYWFFVGAAHEKLGNHELAIDGWKSSISIDPSDEVTFHNLGVSYSSLGRHREAISAFKSALALKPDYVNAIHNTGCEYAFLCENEKAIDSFKSVIAIQPDHPKAYAGLGLVYADTKQFELAVRSYKTAVTLDPDDWSSFYMLGRSQLGLKQNTEAVKAFKTAIRLNPNNALAHAQLGRTYSALGDNPEAMQVLNTAIKLKPDCAEAHLYLAGCYIIEKQLSKAMDHLERAVKLDPNGETGKKAQKLIDLNR